MMKIILKSLLLPVFFVLFFVLTFFNNNISEVSFYEFIYSMGIISSVAIIFFFLFRIFIKNYTKTSLSISFLIIFFFSYYPLYRLIQGIEIDDFLIGRHIVLFPLILSGVIFCLYIFLKSKKNFDNLLKISLVISLVLVMGNIAEISISYTAIDFEKLISDNSSNELSSSDKKYNVYHLILDEYPSSKSLLKFHDFDNSDFENFLRDKGFHIVENSFSNYKSTSESISSILNMDYHNYLESLEDKSRKLAVKHLGEENSVVKNFENLGKIVYTDTKVVHHHTIQRR